MDFRILKVNGEDLSSATHDHIVKVFETASDPIIVEVTRCDKKSTEVKKPSQITDLSIKIPTSFNDSVNPYATKVIHQAPHGYNSPQHIPGLSYCGNHHHTIGLSTNMVPQIPNIHKTANFVNIQKSHDLFENDEDDDDDQVEIIKEEIILRKEHPREIFGLTLSYSAVAADDQCESEVYISAIEIGSVADKISGIKVGDQILQINYTDVHSKAQVVSLFQTSGIEVRLLLGRPGVTTRNKTSFNHVTGMLNCDSSTVNNAENSFVYDYADCCKHFNHFLPQLDKDSGISRGADEITKIEDSSEFDSAPVSFCNSNQISSPDSNNGYVDLQHISLLMKHLVTEYNHLQRLLHGTSESSSARIQPLPVLLLNQSSSRLIPRMGTKMEPPQRKIQNTAAATSSGNTSSCSTGIDSARSSPVTMELCSVYNSTSMLSLKLDHIPKDCHTTNKTLSPPQLNKTNSRAAVLVGSSLTDMDDCTPHSLVSNIGGGCYDEHNRCTTSSYLKDCYGNPTVEKSSPANHIEEHKYVNAACILTDRIENKVEWVVKKRLDGTRYISRRPVRNKLPKDRSRRLNENRNEITTEDEDNSLDFTMIRCSCETNKMHPNKSKEKKCIRGASDSKMQSDTSTNSAALLRSDESLRDTDKMVSAFIVGATIF